MDWGIPFLGRHGMRLFPHCWKIDSYPYLISPMSFKNLIFCLFFPFTISNLQEFLLLSIGLQTLNLLWDGCRYGKTRSSCTHSHRSQKASWVGGSRLQRTTTLGRYQQVHQQRLGLFLLVTLMRGFWSAICHFSCISIGCKLWVLCSHTSNIYILNRHPLS